MPVVVTGASGLVGQRAVAAFLRGAPEVRALVRHREAAEPLRRLGAKVAVGGLDDGETLDVVLRDAHTVCHLVGGLIAGAEEAYEHEVVGTLRAVLDASLRAGIERVLYLSYPGASPDHPNAYLRAKGAAERAIAGSGLEHAVIRCTHVYGPGGEWLRQLVAQARRTPPVVLGPGTQRLAPVYVDDVAAALAAADDRAGPVSGVWSLQGPDVVTADELTDLLAGRPRRKLHAGPGTVRLLRRDMSRAALEVLAADSLADDAPDGAAEFGIVLTPLADGLARSLGSVED